MFRAFLSFGQGAAKKILGNIGKSLSEKPRPKEGSDHILIKSEKPVETSIAQTDFGANKRTAMHSAKAKNAFPLQLKQASMFYPAKDQKQTVLNIKANISGKFKFSNEKDEGLKSLKELNKEEGVDKTTINKFEAAVDKFEGIVTTKEKSLEHDIAVLNQQVVDLIAKHIEKEKTVGQQSDILLNIQHNLNRLNHHFKNSLKNSDEEIKLLKELTNQLIEMKEQIILSRGESAIKLEKIAKIDNEKLETLIQKIDESGKSKLAVWAAYATILSLLVGILVFVYQQRRDKEKEDEQRVVNAEKVRTKSEELNKRIKTIQVKYSGLLIKKSKLEEDLKRLEEKKECLIQLKEKKLKEKSWWFMNAETTHLDLQILQIEKAISKEKIQLESAISELNELELYVSKRKNEAKEEASLDASNDREAEHDRYRPF